MNFKDYIEETKRTAPLLGSEFLDELHMAIGISTEAGEVLDAYKKAFAYGKDLDEVNIEEELGDLLWYMSNLIRILQLDFDTILEKNVAKLRARYKKGFSSEEALNRDLVKEREILELKRNDIELMDDKISDETLEMLSRACLVEVKPGLWISNPESEPE